jgi:putative membrane protein
MTEPQNPSGFHDPAADAVDDGWLTGTGQVDHEPDVRFTYANERTLLAWNRTALALLATGVAATQLLPDLHVPGGRRILGLPLIILGAIVTMTSYFTWRANQRAMRRNEPLPSSPMPLVLSVGIGVIAVIAVVLVLLGAKA